MKQTGPNRLRIELSGDELAEMGLSYELLDYQNDETRHLIISLLETAQFATGFVPGSKMLIEVYPAEADGCTIFFSGTVGERPRRWKVRRHTASPVVYAFNDIDTLIAGSVKLFRRASHRIQKSALYRVEAGYRLAVYPLDLAESITLPLLDEYAPRCGEGALAAAALEEHGELLAKDNAIDLISSYFG